MAPWPGQAYPNADPGKRSGRVRSRFPLVTGLALSAALLLLALWLGWREHAQRDQQSVLRAELVATAIERQLQDRLQLLAERLDEQAVARQRGARAMSPSLAPARPPLVGEVLLVEDGRPGVTADAGAVAVAASPARRGPGAPSGLQLAPPEPGGAHLGRRVERSSGRARDRPVRPAVAGPGGAGP